MNKLLSLLLIALHLVYCDEDNQLKPINIECHSAESHGSFTKCSLKKRSRTLTSVEIEYNLLVFDRAAEFKIVVKQKSLLETANNYRMVFHVEQHICSLMNGSSNAFLGPFIAFLKPYTNLISKCPYKIQKYYIRNLPVTAGFVPALIPSGRYRFECIIVHTATNETTFDIIFTVEIRNKMLFNW